MRIITYSDLHLEFGSDWMLPPDAKGDVMILAGDIITLGEYDPLDRLLQKWKKPVLYVTGNHEYYTRRLHHTKSGIWSLFRLTDRRSQC
jgi:predicted phosphodiesterase